MSRPKQYANNAQRQAAYRERHWQNKPPREDLLATLARSLHGVLEEAVEAGTNVLPAELVGRRVDETLRNLIHYLDPHPDPFRYPADKEV